MNRIVLSGECTIYEIAQRHQQIHDNWKADGNLELEVSAVTAIDASFVQVLASCKKQAEQHGFQILITDSTDLLEDTIKAMYMSDFFAVDEELV